MLEISHCDDYGIGAGSRMGVPSKAFIFVPVWLGAGSLCLASPEREEVSWLGLELRDRKRAYGGGERR